MIEIDGKLISDEVVQAQFVCDLERCKGGCCVEGDAGAPLTKEEADTIKEIYPIVQKYLTEESIAIIEKGGTHWVDEDHDLVTPTIGDGICVYGFHDENGIVKCGIEKAYLNEEIDFKKPISCHLYPIISQEGAIFEIVNYYPRPKLCAPACELGKQLEVPVYQFLKEPLIRKYGQDFYDELHFIAEERKREEE